MAAPTGGGKTRSSSGRLAILAVVSRVRCAALRDLERQSKASRKRKERKDPIVAEEITIALNSCQNRLNNTASKESRSKPGLRSCNKRKCHEDHRGIFIQFEVCF
jgi:hypothetical protein